MLCQVAAMMAALEPRCHIKYRISFDMLCQMAAVDSRIYIECDMVFDMLCQMAARMAAPETDFRLHATCDLKCCVKSLPIWQPEKPAFTLHVQSVFTFRLKWPTGGPEPRSHIE